MLLGSLLGAVVWTIRLSMLEKQLLPSPIPGGQFLVTVKDCPAHCGHNFFDHAKNTGSRVFIIFTGGDLSHFWVVDSSHKNVNMATEKKRVIPNLIETRLMSIPAQSFFVVDWYMYCTTTAWSGAHTIRYHMYLNTSWL